MTSPPMKPGPMRKTEGDILDVFLKVSHDVCYVGELAAIDVVFILPRLSVQQYDINIGNHFSAILVT